MVAKTVRIEEAFDRRVKTAMLDRSVPEFQGLVVDLLGQWVEGDIRTEPMPDGLTPRELELCAALVHVLRAKNLSPTFEGARNLIIHHIELLEKAIRKS